MCTDDDPFIGQGGTDQRTDHVLLWHRNRSRHREGMDRSLQAEAGELTEQPVARIDDIEMTTGAIINCEIFEHAEPAITVNRVDALLDRRIYRALGQIDAATRTPVLGDAAIRYDRPPFQYRL